LDSTFQPPPVPMNAVLSQIDPAENARADFATGVVRITADQFETALAVAGPDARSRRNRHGRLARASAI